MPDIAVKVISIMLTGISIKLLDDYIDKQKIGSVPYIASLACISAGIWRESVSLYLGAYIVGMFHDERLNLVSGLKACHEQLIAFAISIAVTGFSASVSSLLIICIIQLVDDFLDKDCDRMELKHNWAIRIGSVETILASGIFSIISIYLDPFKTIACVSGSLVISAVFNKINNLRVVE